MKHACIERTRPVVIPPYIVPALRSGRVRTLVLPSSVLGPVRRGDGLWVKEGITVAQHQIRKDRLDLIYAGEYWVSSVPWMAALAKPGPGPRPADAMPVQASRFTLTVGRVSHLRLAQVDEDAAVAAGAEPDEGGYGALGFPFMRPFDTHTEALDFMLQQLGSQHEGNPEVAVIHFRAVMRNVALLVRHAE